MNISPTLAINQLTRKRINNGMETFKLGFGQSPFPVPDILIQKLQEFAHVKDYLPTQGLPQLRESIASYHSAKSGHTISPEQVVVGPGSKELIFLTQLSLNRDLVLPSPSWVSYAPQARLLDKPLHWIHTSSGDDWKLNAEKLDAFLNSNKSTSFFTILNNPNNPSGMTYSEKEVKDLSEIARKHDLIIVSDEIYSEFDFNEKHINFSSHYPEGTILCNGLSKWCGAGGWRLGYMIFPEELNDLKIKVIQAGSETYSCASAPVQFAATQAFQGHPEIIHYTKTANAILKYVSNYIQENLDETKIKMKLPQGGFYGFLLFNKEYFGDDNSASLCKRILNETGVALLPGSAFGRKPQELSARIAYVDFNGELIYNSDIIEDSANRSLYLEIPKIREAVHRLNNLNTIN